MQRFTVTVGVHALFKRVAVAHLDNGYSGRYIHPLQVRNGTIQTLHCSALLKYTHN